MDFPKRIEITATWPNMENLGVSLGEQYELQQHGMFGWIYCNSISGDMIYPNTILPHPHLYKVIE